MKTFVTGATGFIGASIVRELLRDGRDVRVLVRSASNLANLKGLDVEIWKGDLLDAAGLRAGLKGCDVLFHAAADYRLWTRNPDEMYRTNVGGTAAVLEAALENNISRVVYTSSVGTLGNPGNGIPGSEDTQVSLDDMVGPYKKSKFLAEREAEKFVSRGLPLVIVNPSTPVGPWDVKPTPTGKIIVDFLKRRMPAYLDTGLNLIDVQECARGHILAEQKGQVGRKYILGNANLSLRDIFRTLQEITGIPAPKVRLPYTPVLVAAWLNEGLSRISGREPLIPLAGVKMAAHHMYFDSGRAFRELGLQQTPVKGALERAVEWFRANGYA
ncbi:MAG: NAD-dependent epimerase/dehydratase family protein [Desulfuromonadaceae bacterium]|nr:NAD-dependent epimerase/dehydratase family protein [Desulfuromonadaceae bacterium]